LRGHRGAEGKNRREYEGEQIRVKLLIGNYDDVRSHELQSLGTQETATFQVTATRDEKPYDVRLTVSPELEQMGLSSTIVRDWAPRMQVEPSTSLVWRGELTAPWEPGIYVVEIVPLARDEEERPIVLGRFRFEWREFAPEVAAEIARRQSCYAMLDGRYEEAVQMAELLLVQHPGSSLAHALLGHIAEEQARDLRERGHGARALVKAQEARAHYQRAMDVLASGQDPLLLRHGSKSAVGQRLFSWKGRVDGIR
jgi:hypothetical protein